MRILEKTVFSSIEPPQTNVLWVKPVASGVTFYLFDDGRWKPANIVNDMGTPTTEDDEVADISNIPQIVSEEVTKQMADYDVSVNDTHNAPSPDENDYPEIDIFNSD